MPIGFYDFHVHWCNIYNRNNIKVVSMNETDKEKPKRDYLKWWLVILCIFSGLATAFSVLVFMTFLDVGAGIIWIYYPVLAVIIGLPSGCYGAWKLKRNNKKRLSLLLSLGLIAISCIAFYYYFLLLFAFSM